jgi:hypothetical protein
MRCFSLSVKVVLDNHENEPAEGVFAISSWQAFAIALCELTVKKPSFDRASWSNGEGNHYYVFGQAAAPSSTRVVPKAPGIPPSDEEISTGEHQES